MIKIKLLNYIFGKKEKVERLEIDNYFKMLNGYSPVFSSYSDGVYEMDLTRTAINNFAKHCSKLKPEIKGSAKKALNRPLEFKPNDFMDTSKFIRRIATILKVDNNVFIIPIEDGMGNLTGYYPIAPQMCEVVESKGIVYLRYTFANGERAAIEFDRVGILNDYQYKDDIFGEDNSTLKPVMQLLHTQNEGIINAVKNSANIRFLGKIQNQIDPKDISVERERFTKDNLSSDNKSGMIIYDSKFSELTPIESKPYTVNAAQMNVINDNVFTHYGTNMDILQNKYDEDIWAAYYEGEIETFAVQLSMVLSNMTYTDRELSTGNYIQFSANRLQYASNKTKLEVSTQMFDRGLFNKNMIMDIWNLPHVEGGDKFYIRKEYAEVNKLDEGITVTPIEGPVIQTEPFEE